MEAIASTYEPPYYAVIFTSVLSDDSEGYEAMATRMMNLAKRQPGFLGVESARNNDSSIGITVSYWKDEKSIIAWKNQVDHKLARKLGKEKWYESYTLRIARVERAYSLKR